MVRSAYMVRGRGGLNRIGYIYVINLPLAILKNLQIGILKKLGIGGTYTTGIKKGHYP